jgi:hypothetical protein
LQKGVHLVPTEYAVWDNEPAIAGAKTPSEINRKQQPQIQPIFVAASADNDRTADRKTEKKKDKKPGFGMMAAGLLLYFLKSTRGDDKART